jgi:RNA polymerase sigma-70 factor, ECF subfamily
MALAATRNFCPPRDNHGAMVSGPRDAADADVIRAARDGDREAFAEIYRRYHAIVYRFARLMSGSTSIAEDITQETFVALMRDLHRYEPHRAALATYLYGVTRNLTRARLRRDRRFVRLDDSGAAEMPGVQDPSSTLAGSRERDRVRQAIAALPSRYREVVILCAIHGLSYADAAAALRLPVGTIRSRLSRGRQAIASRLQEDDSRTSRVAANAARCTV